jgi:5'-methylthioadenosine phosphorylase
VILANELGLKYASLCIVTNYAAGMQERVTLEEVFELMEKVEEKVRNIILDVVEVFASRV